MTAALRRVAIRALGNQSVQARRDHAYSLERMVGGVGGRYIATEVGKSSRSRLLCARRALQHECVPSPTDCEMWSSHRNHRASLLLLVSSVVRRPVAASLGAARHVLGCSSGVLRVAVGLRRRLRCLLRCLCRTSGRIEERRPVAVE